MNLKRYYYSDTYFLNALHPELLGKIVAEIQRKIKVLKIGYDTIACRGLSGLAVAGALSLAENKPITLIRKSDSSHDTAGAKGFIGNTYIIIDDFINSGETIEEIIKEINKRKRAKCVAIFLYNQSETVCGMPAEPSYKTYMKKIIRIVNIKCGRTSKEFLDKVGVTDSYEAYNKLQVQKSY